MGFIEFLLPDLLDCTVIKKKGHTVTLFRWVKGHNVTLFRWVYPLP